MDFKEDFLQFIWQYGAFNTIDLTTTQLQEVRIINFGFLNKHAGPDFTQAKIIVEDTEWVGSVEIHIHSEDWYTHKHHLDANYNSVVLHVVYVHTGRTVRNDGTEIPVLILKDRIKPHIYNNYVQLIQTLDKIACANRINEVNKISIEKQLEKSLIERLMNKSNLLSQKVNLLKGDWEAALYCLLAKNFGFNINADPFEQLSANLPWHILFKYLHNQLFTESLIFGQAGFLNQNHSDSYFNTLKSNYNFLKKKHHLLSPSTNSWKFMRLHPQNFPTLRLAQFAALLCKNKQLFTRMLECHHVIDLIALFKNIPVNSYWATHFHFNKRASKVYTQLGADSIYNILINTASTFLFAYGTSSGNERLKQNAVSLLEYLPAEKNSIVKKFNRIGIETHQASCSQSVLHLNKAYCTQKRCLHCAIGIDILKR